MSVPVDQVNRRTAIKAAIKRASADARANMNALDREALGRLDTLYRQAAADIQASILSYADGSGSVRLQVMRQLLDQVNARLDQLRQAQGRLMNDGLISAAQLGVAPFAEDPLIAGSLNQVADEAVRFVQHFVAADGLQLSDRLWRTDNGARQAVGQAIQQAVVQGQGASEAVNSLLSRGQQPSADLLKKTQAANAGSIANNAINDLLHSDNSARYNMLRVMRTELNRAHGEAYMAGGESVQDFAGWRFLLSPRHPRADICDLHSKANLYGLGPGVYPDRKRCPWPAHPNTLSYVEIVFADEITQEDRLGKIGRIAWLKGQPQHVQDAVLGSRMKRGALQAGILKQNEIATPWNALKKVYEKRGIDIAAITPQPVAVTQLQPPLLVGKIDAATRDYVVAAFAPAPQEVHGLISNSPPLSSLKIIEKGQSYYQSGGNIVLSKTNMQPNLWRHSEYTVYRHEYGHHIDFTALTLPGDKYPSRISYTADNDGGLRNTMDRARSSLHTRSAAQKRRFSALKVEVEKKDGTIQDLFGCLTRNRMGGGHSNSYLKDAGNAETEVFAQLFELYCRSDQSGWKFVAAELPELTDNFKTLVQRMGKA